MDYLLSVCDYIVEFALAKSQNLRNGTAVEIVESRPRSNIYINLPALRKLDAMLIEILDSFQTENSVPCVPPIGLSEKARKHLRHKRECATQIHKAAMSINSSVLSEMEIPDSYMASLPKSGRASIGDAIYRFTYSAEKFSPEYLLDCLKIASEHEAHTWRRKACMSHSKSSWSMMKDLMYDVDRSNEKHILAERAESLPFALKQRMWGRRYWRVIQEC
ncbi:Rop guanine nucleotide exchange factor 4 [Hibiscus syriacus]|uniref:Rop guanine nucleotide exchange factor 4 n=1 Tax=Hibiscus syriacus TaxID=106335 RepID=A0A6A2XGX6_HIBSY|nr:Rop guanine nucleotide exchange factor 4 [Hibiscus syriacus]